MRMKLYVLAVVVMSLAACQTAGISFDSALKNSSTNKPEKVSGLMFKPKSAGPHPAVVLLHTCGGPLQHTTKDWPDYLTGLGYVVFSVDSYGPRGIRNCTSMKDHMRVLVQGVDALGALDYLATQPFIDKDKVAVMGFSSGAININKIIIGGEEASPKGPRFKAAISFYGHCKNIYSNSSNFTLSLEIVAEKDLYHADSCISAGKFDGIDTFVMEGANHAFDMVEHTRSHVDPWGVVMQYDREATKKARELTKAFLAHHLLGLPTEKIWKQARVKSKS